MAFNKKDYDFENVVDVGRQLVIDELERQLAPRNDICTCEECVLDMTAMALNSIPPRYSCSLLGHVYQSDGMNDPGYSASLKHAVKVAIERVSSNPAHSI